MLEWRDNDLNSDSVAQSSSHVSEPIRAELTIVSFKQSELIKKPKVCIDVISNESNYRQIQEFDQEDLLPCVIRLIIERIVAFKLGEALEEKLD